MSKRSILVTGIAGFLGQYIARHFVTKGWEVLGLDQTVLNADALKDLDIASFHLVKLPSPKFETLLKDKKPAGIIHAAGPASVGWSINHPREDFLNSVDAYFYLLDNVRSFSPNSRVIYLSSAAVYGNPKKLPINEDSPLAPISPYGFHKKVCELVGQEFHQIYSVPICAVRIFSAFGEGLTKQVLWDICRKAFDSQEVVLGGTGEETRDFVHATDIARAISLIFEKGKFQCEAYNLAGGKQTSIRELANSLVKGLRQNTVRFTGEVRPGDPIHWQADISRLSELGFEPKMDIYEGIQAYAEWFISNYDRTKHI